MSAHKIITHPLKKTINPSSLIDPFGPSATVLLNKSYIGSRNLYYISASRFKPSSSVIEPSFLNYQKKEADFQSFDSLSPEQFTDLIFSNTFFYISQSIFYTIEDYVNNAIKMKGYSDMVIHLAFEETVYNTYLLVEKKFFIDDGKSLTYYFDEHTVSELILEQNERFKHHAREVLLNEPEIKSYRSAVFYKQYSVLVESIMYGNTKIISPSIVVYDDTHTPLHVYFYYGNKYIPADTIKSIKDIKDLNVALEQNYFSKDEFELLTMLLI